MGGPPVSPFLLGIAAGVLAVPALAAGTVALLLAARALLGTLARLTGTTDARQRAATAAILYGARRARVIGLGDVAVAMVVGLDRDARQHAYDLLKPAPRRLKVNPAIPERKDTDQ